MRKLPLLAMLLFSMTTHAQLGGLLKKAAKTATGESPAPTAASATASGANTPDMGITSPLHQKYLNKLVFANSFDDLKLKEEKEAAFVSSFQLGKPIFFRAYMRESVSNNLRRKAPDVYPSVVDDQARYKVIFYLDGTEAASTMTLMNVLPEGATATWTTFKGAFQAGDDDQNYYANNTFQDFLAQAESKLTPGKHQLKVVFKSFLTSEQLEGDVMASGEITLNVGANAVDPNNAKLCLPKAGMIDKTLEAAALKAFKAKGWPEQPKLVRITSDRWTIVRHEVTGVILRRTLSASVASTRNGKCILQDFLFSQDYDGTSYQDAMYLSGVGEQKDISCQCLK